MPTALEKLAQLEKQVEALRREVAGPKPDDLLEYLTEPLSFQQIVIRTVRPGFGPNELRTAMTELYAAGRIERWDLPRFVRSDVGVNERKEFLRQLFADTPVRQGGGEKLTGLTRGQISGLLTELQKQRGLVRLGPSKGDPWFLARGTQEIERPAAEKKPVEAPPRPATEYRQTKPRARRRRATRTG